jgi:formiminoglutamase
MGDKWFEMVEWLISPTSTSSSASAKVKEFLFMMRKVERPGTRFRDHLDNKVSDWIQPYQEGIPIQSSASGRSVNQGRNRSVNQVKGPFDVAIIGAPLSKTSISHSAASRLPDSIRSAFQSLTPYNMNHRIDISERLSAVDIGNVVMHLTDLPLCQANIEDAVQSYWETFAAQLVILGGDHSITGCSVLGMKKATGFKYGMIHFDAHHDVRNTDDGGRSNGTPFRTILSSCAVSGKHIVQIGLRDYANAKAYHEYVIEQGVTVFTARNVFEQGMAAVLQEAIRIAGDGTDAIYVSFDVDSLDQSFVPGVPAPGPGGLNIWDAIYALEWLGSQKNVCAMDIVCVDPTIDFRDLTTRVSANLVMSFLMGLALR